ncbi:MAG: carbohydrate binding family 9 domain-containing protein [Candidatus Zixiibacteriota bacterium]|nr:MAG: carbohydrate binding family 9 domain-containing protein [candidate division Zixibacteria bacterium]
MLTKPFFRSITIIVTTLTFCQFMPAAAAAQDGFAAQYLPSIHVQRTAGEIKIDGRLDDPGWRGAAMADGFVESYPGDQIKPPVETKAFITYDDDHLYVSFFCYDDPDKTRSRMTERDRTPGDDNVGIFIDTYGDAAWGYILFANSYGVQYDALSTPAMGWDTRFDLIWESAGHVTDSGFQVEMAVPFSSLRFPSNEEQTWRVQFFRYHEREVTYCLSWAAEDRDEQCQMCQWGTLTGIKDVEPGMGIEILPAYTAYQAGALTIDTSNAVNFLNGDAYGELSLGTKYSPSSNMTVEATYNPDFSQVEADADQVDVNTTTALYFPEKRPFFQEGSDLFSTLYETVDTRSINDPDFAAKMTLRTGRTSIAWLAAHDETSPMIIPFEEFSTRPLLVGKSTTNILRSRLTYGDNSQVGFLLTDRRFEGGGSGSAFSADGSFRLSKSFCLQWQAVASYTDEPSKPVLTEADTVRQFANGTVIETPFNDYQFDGEHTAGLDGESFWGHAYIGLLDYISSDVYLSGRYSEISSTYRADNGYEPLNDRRQASVIARYIFRSDDGLIESVQPNVFAAQFWNTAGEWKEKWVKFNLETNFRKAQTSTHMQYMRGSEKYAGIEFDDIWAWHLCLHATPSNLLSLSGGINYSHQIARGPRAIGKQTDLSASVHLKPMDRLESSSSFVYAVSKDVNTDAEFFRGNIVRTRLNYQYNRELSVRLVFQYNDFYQTWDLDPLITYRINPFTLFYVGSTYDYERRYGLNQDGSMLAAQGQESYAANRLTSRQFFVKLQYLFQI